MDADATIEVFIRVRPQAQARSCIEDIEADQKTLHVRKDFESRRFRFSKVFGQTSSQQQIFEEAATPVLRSVVAGYNGCILAYGQTGTGKTHTILGNRDGILPEALRFLFREQSGCVVEMSCL